MRIIMTLVCGLVLVSCASQGVKNLSDARTQYQDVAKPQQLTYLEGTVIDSSTKKVIKGAVVEIKNANRGVGYYKRVTDESGRFRLDEYIPHIKYVMEITALGYVPSVSTGFISQGLITVSLEQEAVLAGSVKDSSGRIIQGVHVTVVLNGGGEQHEIEEEGGGESRTVAMETDKTGEYRFTGLRPGEYLVSYSSPGYIAETAQVKYIREGETFRLPMIMFKPSVIIGAVRIADTDAPAVGVTITAKGQTTSSVDSYPDGTFRIEDLKPGKYQLLLEHQGFQGMKSAIIAVKEGTTTDNLTFSMSPRMPEVQIYAYRYTFTPGDKIEFNLRTFRLETVKATVYHVPMEFLMKGVTDPDNIDPLKNGFKIASSWEEAVHDFTPYEWRYGSLAINGTLPTGSYCIEILGADKVINRKFFTVTSVGIVVKRTPTSVMVYASNLVDNAPIENAQVLVYETRPKKNQYDEEQLPQRIEDLPVNIIKKGKTDANGIAHLTFQAPAWCSVLVISGEASYAICNSATSVAAKGEKVRYFIYTDRPVYRAGDTVHFKVIAKESKQGFNPFSERKFNYRVRNVSLDKMIAEGQLDLDDWGTAIGKVDLDPSTSLGSCEITVWTEDKETEGRGTFYLEQYRKPEFKIDITSAAPYYVNGDTAEFKIETEYFFGAPMKGCLVRYRFYENRMEDADGSYWWEDGYEQRPTYNRVRLEGEKYADDQGIAVLKLEAGRLPYDRELTLEATVIDKSNVSITSTGKVRVGRGDYYIRIRPASAFFSGNEKKTIDIETLNQTGTPVDAELRLDLYRYIWKPVQRVYVHEKRPLYSRKVVTKNGAARIELPENMNVYGEFDIVVEGRDRRDNTILASRVVWIYSTNGVQVASRFKNLEMDLDKTILTGPGELTCLLKSRYTDAYVCLTLEGRDVYESRVIKMDGNIVPIKFNIKDAWAPNMYISAVMQRKKALYHVNRSVSLPVKDTTLSITLDSDKKIYAPGDEAQINIKACDEQGHALKADLSLAVVDEAVFQIRRDHTPLMRDFFYAKISNWVTTSYSYPVTLLAGASKNGKQKVRENFKDTALWVGTIRTDEKGNALVKIPLPDNLTEWRLTARGHDRNGRVGEKKTSIQVTKDLIGRIGKPRFMVSGDRVDLIGIVNSNTNKGFENIATEMKANGKIINPIDTSHISLPAYGSASRVYPFNVPEKGDSLKLEFSAKATTDATDTLSLSVPIESKGILYRVTGNGDCGANRQIVLKPLSSTEDFDFVPEKLTITVHPSPVIMMVRSLKYLKEYPYGCVEQTMNKFIPVLAMKKLSAQKTVGELVEPYIDPELDSKVTAGINHIIELQRDDGTWGWFSGDNGNAFLTAFVLASLHTAQQMEYFVDPSITNNGLEAVRRMLFSDKIADDEKAILHYVNALHGRWLANPFLDLINKKEHDTYTIAYMIRGEAHLLSQGYMPDDHESIKKQIVELTERLKSRIKKDDKGVYWESNPSRRNDWPGGDTELTSLVLSALVEAGDSSPVPAQIIRSLANRSKGDAWGSTRETASVILALCSFMEKNPLKSGMKDSVRFSIDGKEAASLSWDLSAMKDISSLTVDVPVTTGSKDANFTVLVNGGSPDISYTASVAGRLHFRTDGFFSIFKNEEKSIDKLSNGLKLVRTFLPVARVRDVKGAEYLVPQSMSEKKVLHVGDEILVRLRFTSADDFHYLVMEDYLPSGFEVVKGNIFDEYNPFVHSERWDNRMVYFFSDLKKGEVYEVAYIIRAELSGRFMVRPSRMECMYEQSIQGWAAPVILEVNDGK